MQCPSQPLFAYPWQQHKYLNEFLELKAQYKVNVLEKAIKYDQQEAALNTEVELSNQSAGRGENIDQYRYKMAALEKELEIVSRNRLRLERDRDDFVYDIGIMARTFFAFYDDMLFDYLDGTLPIERFKGYLEDYRTIMMNDLGLTALQQNPAEKIWAKIHEICPSGNTN